MDAVADLQQMFPSIEEQLIRDVLSSCGSNVEQAAEFLLSLQVPDTPTHKQEVFSPELFQQD
jgi:hypothetical protein